MSTYVRTYVLNPTNSYSSYREQDTCIRDSLHAKRPDKNQLEEYREIGKREREREGHYTANSTRLFYSYMAIYSGIVYITTSSTTT